MPNYRANRIASRYRRRAQSVGPETARLRGKVAKTLVVKLREGTEAELYRRTPLPVTRDMFNSIGVALRGNVVEVGYGFFGKGKHAKYRVNMTGRSKAGGHQLDMHPAEYLRAHADPEIKKATRAAQRRIIEK